MRRFLMLLCAVLVLAGAAAHAADIALLPHVPDNATLSATKSTAYAYLVRDDFSVGFGAPPLTYKTSALACPLNAGAGDGGSQVPSADGKCWLAVFPSGAPDARLWGATTTDATGALNAIAIKAALTSMNAAQLPEGTWNINASIPVGTGQEIHGQDQWSTIVTPQGNYPAFTAIGVFGAPVAKPEVSNMRINCTWGATHGNTLAHGIKSVYAYNARFHDLIISGCEHAVELEDQYTTILNNILMDGAGVQQNDTCLYMGSPTNYPADGLHNNGVKAVNVFCYNFATTGFRGIRFDGSQITNSEFIAPSSSGPCIYIGDTPISDPPEVHFGAFSNVLAEGCTGAWYISQGSNTSPVAKLQIDNSWAASGSGSGGGANDNTLIFCGGCTQITLSNMITSGGKNAVVLQNSVGVAFDGKITDYNWDDNGGVAVSLVGGTDNIIQVKPSVHSGSTVLGFNGYTEDGTSARNQLYGFGRVSWTPGYAGSTNAGTPTYGIRVGSAEREGQLVNVTWNLSTSAFAGPPTGTMLLTGLPFTAENINGSSACPIWFQSGVTLAINYYSLQGDAAAASTNILFQESGPAVATAGSAVGEFAPAFQTSGSCSYAAK